jgi:hypothetical protein
LVCTIGGTTGRALLNKLPPMVDTYGLLLGRGVRVMIKIDTIGREWCLPCADSLEVEGVIVEREGECLGCERERARARV